MTAKWKNPVACSDSFPSSHTQSKELVPTSILQNKGSLKNAKVTNTSTIELPFLKVAALQKTCQTNKYDHRFTIQLTNKQELPWNTAGHPNRSNWMEDKSRWNASKSIWTTLSNNFLKYNNEQKKKGCPENIWTDCFFSCISIELSYFPVVFTERIAQKRCKRRSKS